MSEDLGGLGAFRGPQQGDERDWAELQDQFGRRWGCIWDFGRNAQAPVSVLQPLGWTDRLNTPPMYMRFTRLNNLRFTIDTQAWINDRDVALDTYRERVNLTAVQMSPADGGLALLGADPYAERGVTTISYALSVQVGPAPLSSVPIRALEAGNKYVLGTSDKMPKWAAPFFVAKKSAVVEFPDAEDEGEEVAQQDEQGVLLPPTLEEFPEAEDEPEDAPEPSVLGGLGLPRQAGGKFAKRR